MTESRQEEPSSQPAVRRIVLHGGYGIASAGDDAPLVVLADGLRARHPDVHFDLTVLARHDDPLMAARCDARYLANLEHQSRDEANGRWFKGFNPGENRGDLDAVGKAIREADLVIAGAGNMLIDLSFDVLRGPVPLCAVFAFLADQHQTPFYLYGMSAGPLERPDARDLAAWIVRRSAAVTCRDESSAALLHTLSPQTPITVLPDSVLALKPASDEALAALYVTENIPPRGERPRLAISVRELAGIGRVHETLAEALEPLTHSYDLLFVPQCTYTDSDDREEAHALAGLLPGARCYLIEQRHSPEVLMRVYEGADVTLAIRLHGAVFSAMAGTPVVALAYLPKVRSFMEAVGQADSCFDLDALSAETLTEAIIDARLSHGPSIRARCRELAKAVEGYLERAEDLLGLGG